MRKLMRTGLLAVAGVFAFTADASAFGKRKKNRGGCDDCATSYAVPVSSGCGGCGTAWAGGPVGYAVAPEAMPATGVVPAAGTVLPQTTVVPAGGYYLPNGQYVTPAGYGTFQGGFSSGVIQGAFGTPTYYPYGGTIPGNTGNNLGRQVGRGIFRR